MKKLGNDLPSPNSSPSVTDDLDLVGGGFKLGLSLDAGLTFGSPQPPAPRPVAYVPAAYGCVRPAAVVGPSLKQYYAAPYPAAYWPAAPAYWYY